MGIYGDVVHDVRLQPDVDQGIGFQAASKSAGRYLDEVKVYDLRQMTREQWQAFMSTIVSSAINAMSDEFEARMKKAMSEIDQIPY